MSHWEEENPEHTGDTLSLGWPGNASGRRGAGGSGRVPLKSVEVELQVKDHVATVISTLNYQNKEDKPIEALFVFPLPGDAAVCHFSADIGQTHIVAELKEKQQAREEYDDALSSGQQAFLLEESEQNPDIFSLSVGSLPPGESASIRLQYVIELAVEADGALRFCLPAVLNPRYQPQGSEGPGVPVSSVPASEIPYSLSFSSRVSSPRPVSKVESSCSLEPLHYLNTDHTEAAVKLAAGHKFDRDVELLIYYKDAHQPSAVVEAGQDSAQPGTLMGDPVVMASFYPNFPESVQSSSSSCGEFVFLLDRSGSMDFPMADIHHRTRIDSAKETLLLLLKSLPMGCYFNIYSFGDRFEHLFQKSLRYSQKTMKQALKKVEEMSADLGGTDILEPLQHIYRQSCIRGQPRQLFVFTDGEVSNTKEILDLVKENCASYRCFSFGIGPGASSALVNGMAKEGGGHAQFITDNDRMQLKAMQSLRLALQPSVEDISLTWDLPAGVTAKVLSPTIQNIFQGQRSVVFAQLTGQSSKTGEGSLTVKYSIAGHSCQNQLFLSLKPAPMGSCTDSLTVHHLAALTLIRRLEMEERGCEGEQSEGVKKKLVEVSVESGVSSAFTAFIAVDKSNNRIIKGPLITQELHADLVLKGSLFFFGDDDDDLFGGNNVFRRIYSSLKKRPKKSLSLKKCDSKPRYEDPLLQLVSLQEACGRWLLDPALAIILGKSREEVKKAKPTKVSKAAWATVLALIWLHSSKVEAKKEWELIAVKAVSWLKTQKVASMSDCVAAGNALLCCNVQTDTLGL
ncbi:von Willebrand factor A domain-containing protein 5A isoform X2 [Oryzias latipes]|uniref:von Willebrand factor A domain-containing protein 5A isoform X2 n=1 Tax=Oryzias latipes TaxID=8090 RepID=UPI0009DABF11|nr:von Willebrand factor A domain-containing protein 5A isoform X2 [Oryzias latipes]